MDFKELLEAYKKGETTPEQSRLVEEEIEKNKLINDYICGEMELEPPGPEGDTETKPDKASIKAVKKIMRRTLLKVGAITAVVVLAALLATEYIVSPLVASRYYNPGKVIVEDNPYPLTQGAIDTMVASELMSFSDVLTSYVVDDLGYGKYHIQRGMYDLFDQEYNFEDIITTRGKGDKQYWVSTLLSPYCYHSEYDFLSLTHKSDEQSIAPGTRTYFSGPETLQSIPDTAVVEAAILFPDELSVQELVALMGENSGLFFEWVAVSSFMYKSKVEDNDYYLGWLGFRPEYIPGSTRVPPGFYPNYPNLSLPENVDMNAEMLQEHFTSLLSYYCNRLKTSGMINDSSQTKIMSARYQAVLDEIQQKGIKTYGAVVIGSPHDITTLYQSGIINGIEVYDVKFSIYENENF